MFLHSLAFRPLFTWTIHPYSKVIFPHTHETNVLTSMFFNMFLELKMAFWGCLRARGLDKSPGHRMVYPGIT